MVGIKLGDKEEKGLVCPLLLLLLHVAVDKVDGIVVDGVHPEAGEIVALHIPVKQIAVVTVGGPLQGISNHPVLIAAPAFRRNRLGAVGTALAGGQVPFAHIGGFVTGGVEPAGQGVLHAFRQDVMVGVAVYLCGVHPALQAGAGGAADRLAGKGVFKAGPLRGETVQVWRDGESLAVAAQGIPALLVGKVKDDVWSGHCFFSFLCNSVYRCSRLFFLFFSLQHFSILCNFYSPNQI